MAWFVLQELNDIVAETLRFSQCKPIYEWLLAGAVVYLAPFCSHYQSDLASTVKFLALCPLFYGVLVLYYN